MMLPNIVSRRTAGTDLLRLVLCAILFTHGAYRFYDGTVPVLGDILHEEGLPYGAVLAYLVDLAEVGGTLLLALRLLVVPVCGILCMIYSTGIVLFHWHAGFFVVGPGNNGWEYSALLITCLLVTAWENRSRGFLPFGAASGSLD
ncbi:MAG TPA: DoxX family protein [Xanthomonadaceae bacterium]|jgi:putative oxidoreductase